MTSMTATNKSSGLLDQTSSELARDAVQGLTAPEKSLNPKWLYDSVGSALFEKITTLPEYYLTRTETAILQTHAADLMGLLPEDGVLVEFGSGASVKTRTLLDAAPDLGVYVPVDISEAFLHETADDLRKRYPSLEVTPVVGDFNQPVPLPPTLASAAKIGFFPGSTIGNITPQQAQDLLTRMRAWPGLEAFILGVDLIKDPDIMTRAYDDAAGVTAKFISNILLRLNTEERADFDLSNFTYEAKWDSAKARIEMSLISSVQQTVDLSGTCLEFQKGEKIAISQSRKYSPETLRDLARATGWRVDQMLTDPDQKFAVTVLKPSRA